MKTRPEPIQVVNVGRKRNKVATVILHSYSPLKQYTVAVTTKTENVVIENAVFVPGPPLKEDSIFSESAACFKLRCKFASIKTVQVTSSTTAEIENDSIDAFQLDWGYHPEDIGLWVDVPTPAQSSFFDSDEEEDEDEYSDFSGSWASVGSAEMAAELKRRMRLEESSGEESSGVEDDDGGVADDEADRKEDEGDVDEGSGWEEDDVDEGSGWEEDDWDDDEETEDEPCYPTYATEKEAAGVFST